MVYEFLYHPSWNIVHLKSINATSPHLWVYLLLIFFSSTIILFRTMRLPVLKNFSRLVIIRSVTLCGFLILLAFQIHSQNAYLKSNKDSFFGKTIEQKYSRIYGNSYSYSKFVFQNFPGECIGKLITDFDSTATLEPYVLKYFLFPSVNIIDQSGTQTCLVIFEKTDPDSFVPADFEVVGRFNKNSLIAVKKK